MTELPGSRRLLMTWGLLVLMTCISMLSARLDQADWQVLPLWSGILILLATGFKAQCILMIYLNLRASSPSWKGSFSALTLLTLILIAAGYLVGYFELAR